MHNFRWKCWNNLFEIEILKIVVYGTWKCLYIAQFITYLWESPMNSTNCAMIFGWIDFRFEETEKRFRFWIVLFFKIQSLASILNVIYDFPSKWNQTGWRMSKGPAKIKRSNDLFFKSKLNAKGQPAASSWIFQTKNRKTIFLQKNGVRTSNVYKYTRYIGRKQSQWAHWCLSSHSNICTAIMRFHILCAPLYLLSSSSIR